MTRILLAAGWMYAIVGFGAMTYLGIITLSIPKRGSRAVGWFLLLVIPVLATVLGLAAGID